MRELTYKDIIRTDLSNLNRWKFSIIQHKEELQTLNAEYTAIKATNYDKMPNGTGENHQEEKLITAIARKGQLEAELAFTERKVADIERLLNELSDDERRIIERMEVNRESHAADSLAQELGYDPRQIFNKRNAALANLCRLRYGASFNP